MFEKLNLVKVGSLNGNLFFNFELKHCQKQTDIKRLLNIAIASLLSGKTT